MVGWHVRDVSCLCVFIFTFSFLYPSVIITLHLQLIFIQLESNFNKKTIVFFAAYSLMLYVFTCTFLWYCDIKLSASVALGEVKAIICDKAVSHSKILTAAFMWSWALAEVKGRFTFAHAHIDSSSPIYSFRS